MGASAGTPSEPLVVVDHDEAASVKLTPNQRAFLLALAECAGNISAGARKCNQARMNHYLWLREVDAEGNPTPRALAYRAAIEEIQDETNDAIRAEIYRRGVLGYDKAITFQGRITDTVREFDTTLLIFEAKARMRELYQDRHEFTGANGTPLHPSKVTVDVNVNYAEALKSLTEEELESHNAIAAKLLARSGGSIPTGSN